jgi:hypothetical protein
MNRLFSQHVRVSLIAAFVLLMTGTPSVTHALNTFHVEGHMTDPSGPDLKVGDTFSADFTFDPLAPSIGPGPEADAVFLAITDWQFAFDAGYEFKPSNANLNAIDLSNNNTNTYPSGIDRFIASLLNVSSVGAPFPSGRVLQYLQFDIQDTEPTGAPDLFSDLTLPAMPPNIALGTFAGGRLVFDRALDDFGQPYFQIDSISLVPEPAALWLLSVGLILPTLQAHRKRRRDR